MNRIDLGARSLEYAEGGDLAGAPVLVHHGTPGAAVLRPEWEELAAAHGLRLVIHSRPGYGSSTRLPGRNVADAAGDTAALADALGVARFLTLGYSGGGPHALACAALLPERVVAAVTLASVAPHDADQLDFLAGMGEGNIEEFGRARAGEEPLRELLEAEVGAMLGGSAAGLAESMAPFLSPVDAEEIRGPIAAWLQENVDRALGTGVDGWLDDDLAFVRPWGFEPAAVVKNGSDTIRHPAARATACPRPQRPTIRISVSRRVGQTAACAARRSAAKKIMPELPEVETTRRGLAPFVSGAIIESAVVRNRALRQPVTRNINRILAGRRIDVLERRAKYLLFRAGDGTLIVHLGMSGRLRIVATPTGSRST